MLISYTENRFPVDYVPTVFDNFNTGTEVDGKCINFAIWDTAGQEEYARLRTLSYPETDVFLLCFSVALPSSFDNIKSKWFPEVSHHCPEAALILIGTKIDLRSDKHEAESLAQRGENFVTKEMGIKMASMIGAKKYMECSALTQEGLRDAFDESIRAVIGAQASALSAKKKKQKKNCSLL